MGMRITQNNSVSVCCLLDSLRQSGYRGRGLHRHVPGVDSLEQTNGLSIVGHMQPDSAKGDDRYDAVLKSRRAGLTEDDDDD